MALVVEARICDEVGLADELWRVLDLADVTRNARRIAVVPVHLRRIAHKWCRHSPDGDAQREHVYAR